MSIFTSHLESPTHRVLGPDACLVTALAEHLTQIPQTSLRNTLVLLPTRRLQLHLSAQLALRGDGVSWLPRMKTWDQFLSEQLLDYQDQKMVMVSSVAELFLAANLQTHKLDGIHEQHSHELLHLLRELWRNGVRVDAQATMNSWLERQWHLSPDGLSQLQQRLSLVFSVFEQFEKDLATHNYVLGEQQTAEALPALIADIKAGKWQSPAERVIVAGLTSLPAVQSQLLEALASHKIISTWFNAPWVGLDQEAPLRKLHAAVGKSVADVLVPDSRVRMIHSCADPTQEVAVALERAQDAFANGVPWHRMIIAVPDETIYATALAAMSESLAVERNVPLARPWLATHIGQWFGLYSKWLSENTSSAWIYFAMHPLTKSILLDLVPHPKALSEACDAYEEWLRFAPWELSTVDELMTSLQFSKLSSDHQENLLAAWHQLRGDARRNLLEHALWWQKDVLQKLESSSHVQEGLPLETSAYQALKSAVDGLCDLPRVLFHKGHSHREFVQSLAQVVRATSIRETGEPLKGLQILSLTEARYVPCDVLILVGLAEGIFPHRLPRDTLVDNSLKVAAGMSGWRQLEALEETTFTLLTSRIAHVELTTPEMIQDGPVTRSRWIEILLAQGVPHVRHNHEALASLTARSVESQIAPQVDKPEGVVADISGLLGHASARSLKALMACPYQFLLQSRGVKDFETRGKEDPLLVGNLLHRVIEYCCQEGFDQKVQMPEEIAWRNSFSSSQDLYNWALARLNYLTKIVIPKSMRSMPLILEVEHKGWPELAGSWAKLFDLGWNASTAQSELVFGKDVPLSISVRDKPVLVTGIMDVVYRANDGSWHISDYKTQSTPKPASIKKGLEPQLLLYALCLNALDNNAIPARGVVSYWNLADGKLTPIAYGAELAPAVMASLGKSKNNLGALLEDFTLKWHERITSVQQQQRFFADPSACGFCDYSNICRKDDPRHRERIQQQGAET